MFFSNFTPIFDEMNLTCHIKNEILMDLDEILMIDHAAILTTLPVKCSLQNVRIVEMKPKFLLNPMKAVLFIVKIVFQNIKNRDIKLFLINF